MPYDKDAIVRHACHTAEGSMLAVARRLLPPAGR